MQFSKPRQMLIVHSPWIILTWLQSLRVDYSEIEANVYNFEVL